MTNSDIELAVRNVLQITLGQVKADVRLRGGPWVVREDSSCYRERRDNGMNELSLLAIPKSNLSIKSERVYSFQVMPSR